MKELYLCIHHGFGDYVVCYGLVKELAKRYDTIYLFAINHRSYLQTNNIRRLYSSIENVRIITDDPNSIKDVFYIGGAKFSEAAAKNPNIEYQRFFYDQAGVPLNLLWDNFYFERNMEREKRIYYDILGLKDNEEYIFLHDDPVRHFVINKKYIPDLKIIHLVDLPEISILDTLYLVEKAKQVHMTNTGLVSFVDQMNIKHSSLNYHKYVRPLAFEQPILKLNWKIIN
jgi:hypothetical protein